VNVREDDRLMIVTWLIECLRPDTPHVVLEFGRRAGERQKRNAAGHFEKRRYFWRYFSECLFNNQASMRVTALFVVPSGRQFGPSRYYKRVSKSVPHLQGGSVLHVREDFEERIGLADAFSLCDPTPNCPIAKLIW